MIVPSAWFSLQTFDCHPTVYFYHRRTENIANNCAIGAIYPTVRFLGGVCFP